MMLIIRSTEMETHFGTVELLCRLNICLVQLLIPLDVGEKIDLEVMLGIESMAIHGIEGKSSVISRFEIDEQIPIRL